MVLKSEAVYTRGRRDFSVDPAAPGGLVPRNTANYVVGLDFALPASTNLNVQVFDNYTVDRDPTLFFKEHETGASMLVKRDFGNNVEAQALYVRSFARNDWWFKPTRQLLSPWGSSS